MSAENLPFCLTPGNNNAARRPNTFLMNTVLWEYTSTTASLAEQKGCGGGGGGS